MNASWLDRPLRSLLFNSPIQPVQPRYAIERYAQFAPIAQAHVERNSDKAHTSDLCTCSVISLGEVLMPNLQQAILVLVS